MIQLFGPRPVVKKRTPVTLGPQGSAMETGYGAAASMGGGIQPGAHPEYEKGVQLGNPLTQLRDLFKNGFKPRKVKPL